MGDTIGVFFDDPEPEVVRALGDAFDPGPPGRLGRHVGPDGTLTKWRTGSPPRTRR